MFLILSRRADDANSRCGSSSAGGPLEGYGADGLFVREDVGEGDAGCIVYRDMNVSQPMPRELL